MHSAAPPPWRGELTAIGASSALTAIRAGLDLAAGSIFESAQAR